MKKKLLVLAVAGAFVAPVAMADTANVNVYGVASVSYDSMDNNPTAGNGTRASKISSNASRIGFKGSESLSGGTSAIWQIESAVFLDNSSPASTVAGAPAGTTTSSGFGTRNTFAGLSGESWGSLVLGRTDTAYKVATRRLDLFDETLADNRTLMGNGVAAGAQGAIDSRRSDVAHYTSPNMSGFSVALTIEAGAETATTGANVKGSGYALAGMYDAGPLYATLAYTSSKFGTPGTGTLANAAVDTTMSAYKLGAGYKAEQFEGVFVYEKTRDEFGAACGAAAKTDCFGHNAYYIGGKFNVSGNDAVKLAYTRTNESAGVKNNAAKQVSLGYDHAMSKRTTIYALYTKLNNDAAAVNGLSTYADNESTGASVGAIAAGSDPSAISIGMKHTF